MAVVSMAELKASWPATPTTSRLVLREIKEQDVPDLSQIWTDPAVRQHLGGPVTAEELTRRQRGCVNAPGLFCVLRQADDNVLGLVSVEPGARDGKTEVSYQLLPEHWGRGYGREAVAAVTDWAMDTLASVSTEVVAVTQEANVRSRRLLESIGMTPVSRFVEWDAPQVMYSVVRADRRSDS